MNMPESVAVTCPRCSSEVEFPLRWSMQVDHYSVGELMFKASVSPQSVRHECGEVSA